LSKQIQLPAGDGGRDHRYAPAFVGLFELESAAAASCCVPNKPWLCSRELKASKPSLPRGKTKPIQTLPS